MLRRSDVGVGEMKTELVKRHIAPEMLALSAVELILTFTLALILLTPSSSSLNLASVHFAISLLLYLLLLGVNYSTTVLLYLVEI